MAFSNPLQLTPERVAAIHDTEAALLSIVFIAQRKIHDEENGYRLSKIFANIVPDDFDDIKYGTIFAAMRNLYQRREEITPAALNAECQREGLDCKDSVPRITQALIANGQPTDANASFFIKAIKQNSLERHALQFIADNVEAIREGTAEENAVSLLAAGLAKLYINSREQADKEKTCAEIVADEIDVVGNEYEMTDEERKTNSYLFPFASLNRLSEGGMMRDDLWTIMAGAGVGKTAIALQISNRLADKYEKNVLYVSTEINPGPMYRRLFSMNSKVNYGRIMHALGPEKFKNEEEFDSVVVAAGELMKQNRLTIRKSNRMAVIDGWIQTLAVKGKLDVLVLDYLQLLHPIDEKRNYVSRVQILEDNMDTIKQWAADYHLVVIVLSQPNRSRDNKDDDGNLTIDSLMGSSAIGNYSDAVVAMNRKKDDEHDILAELVKCRNGRLGKFWLDFYGKIQTFKDCGIIEDDERTEEEEETDRENQKQAMERHDGNKAFFTEIDKARKESDRTEKPVQVDFEAAAKEVKKKRNFDGLPKRIQKKIIDDRFQKSCDDLFDKAE